MASFIYNIAHPSKGKRKARIMKNYRQSSRKFRAKSNNRPSLVVKDKLELILYPIDADGVDITNPVYSEVFDIRGVYDTAEDLLAAIKRATGDIFRDFDVAAINPNSIIGILLEQELDSSLRPVSREEAKVLNEGYYAVLDVELWTLDEHPITDEEKKFWGFNDEH